MSNITTQVLSNVDEDGKVVPWHYVPRVFTIAPRGQHRTHGACQRFYKGTKFGRQGPPMRSTVDHGEFAHVQLTSARAFKRVARCAF